MEITGKVIAARYIGLLLPTEFWEIIGKQDQCIVGLKGQRGGPETCILYC